MKLIVAFSEQNINYYDDYDIDDKNKRFARINFMWFNTVTFEARKSKIKCKA